MGKSADFPELFPITLGGNTFGWTCDQATSFKVLDAFIQNGGNNIDTADNYSAFAPGNEGGESETVIGNWLSSRNCRKELFIASKVGQHPQYRGLSHDNILAAIEQSLRRLKTDYLDLYYAHEDDPRQDIGDIAASFDALVRAGKIRRIGISNMSPQRVTAWLRVAEINGFTGPAALQPHYNLLARGSYEQDYEPLALKHGLKVFPYLSLAAGLLTGKYRTRGSLQGNAREGRLSSYGDRAFQVIDVLVGVADEAKVAPATVALAWELSRKSVTGPIASVSAPQQLPDILTAASLRLSSDQISRLKRISNPQP